MSMGSDLNIEMAETAHNSARLIELEEVSGAQLTTTQIALAERIEYALQVMLLSGAW